MQQNLQNKNGLVKEVFNKVFDKYDLMNDCMSLGIHRIWKKDFIKMMNPTSKKKLIDVGCGTGDIANLFIKATNNNSSILCIDPNKKMIDEGKKKLKKYKNIKWINAPAERIPIGDNTFDYYSISYGIRNVSDINTVLKEAFRVLKPGGRFMCLEFSKIDNELLNYLYKKYSKTIPLIGKFIVGSDKPYKYLIESIEKFYNQEQLVELILDNGFSNVEFRNVSNGISAIHSGWKI